MSSRIFSTSIHRRFGNRPLSSNLIARSLSMRTFSVVRISSMHLRIFSREARNFRGTVKTSFHCDVTALRSLFSTLSVLKFRLNSNYFVLIRLEMARSKRRERKEKETEKTTTKHYTILFVTEKKVQLALNI